MMHFSILSLFITIAVVLFILGSIALFRRREEADGAASPAPPDEICKPTLIAGPMTVTIADPPVEADAIFIDDDALIRQAWQMRAKDSGKRLQLYESAEAFRKIRAHVPRTIPIFIDSSLGDGVKGEEFAKELYGEGFRELYLSTGYPASFFGAMPWLKGVIGKDPPGWVFG
jgi:hypothetical protein